MESPAPFLSAPQLPHTFQGHQVTQNNKNYFWLKIHIVIQRIIWFYCHPKNYVSSLWLSLFNCRIKNNHIAYVLSPGKIILYRYIGVSLAAQMVRNLPAMQETPVRSLGWEDPLKKGMAAHSSILAWRIPWTEEPAGPQSMGLRRARHDWATNTFHYSYTERCLLKHGFKLLYIFKLIFIGVKLLYNVVLVFTAQQSESATHACVLSLFSHVRFFATPWTAACKALLSMGILQARTLEWVAIPSSRGSSQPRDRTHISYIACIGRHVLYPLSHLGSPNQQYAYLYPFFLGFLPI